MTTTRAKKYLLRAKAEAQCTRYYINQGGYTERTIVEKLRIRKGGKIRAAQLDREAMTDQEWNRAFF